MTSSTTENANALTLSDLVENPTLRTYLRNVRDWHGYVRFLGLPDRRDNPDVLIDRLFVEPLLTRRHVSPDENPSSWIDEAETVFDALKIDRPVVLLGDPGTGKSTLLNYLVWLLARPTGEIWTERMGGGWLLPIPMVLRELHLHGVNSFSELLSAFLNHAMSTPLREGDYLVQMLKKGRAFILLDGVDEMGDPTARRNLRAAVFDGFDLYPRCRWLLSSRVVGYDEVPFNRAQGQQAKSSISIALRTEPLKQSLRTENRKPFVQSGLHELPKAGHEFYDGCITRYIAPFDDRRIEAFARNWYVQREPAAARAGEDAAHLVRAVHADDAILRLARVPNLLTLMALIHRIEATLPHGRALLYERISEAYLESIDKFRGIYSGAYNLPQKRRWLARVGYEMQRRRSTDQESANGTSESELLAESGDVIYWLNEEMEHGGTFEGLSAKEFLDFVGRRSGLFLPRSEGRYAFVHLSFQEYFAAVALEREVTGFKWARNEQTPLGLERTLLAAWAKQSAWRETFSFLFELLVSKEDWHAHLLDAVFGESFSQLEESTPDESDMNLAQLLADLSVNQRSGLARENKFSAITAVVRIVLQHLKSVNHPPHEYRIRYEFNTHSIFRKLLGDDSDWNPKILKLIGEQAKKLRVQSLSLAQTRISDSSSLAYFTDLKHLDLIHTQVSDLGPLAHLTQLESLYLGGDIQVPDFGPLVHLTKLKSLFLIDTQVSDLGLLVHLTQLESLYLMHTQVSDLGPLVHLTQLESLDLIDTQVSDLGPLAHLTRLKHLALRSTQVSDLGSLIHLTQLESLDLMNTQVSDLGSLIHLTQLESLDLMNTQVSDLGSLIHLTQLESLDLMNTQVSDLGPLIHLTELEFLDLENTQVSDLGPLAHLRELKHLNLKGTQVSDLGPLVELTEARIIQ